MDRAADDDQAAAGAVGADRADDGRAEQLQVRGSVGSYWSGEATVSRDQ
ncbi:hypothetical protein [Kribbella solani]|nr:hypothetical protein [Kribbella solani]